MSEHSDRDRARDPYPWLRWEGLDRWRALWPSIGEDGRRANAAALAALGDGHGQRTMGEVRDDGRA